MDEPHAAFTPVLPSRAITYADDETDAERLGIFEMPSYAEQIVSAQVNDNRNVLLT